MIASTPVEETRLPQQLLRIVVSLLALASSAWAEQEALNGLQEQVLQIVSTKCVKCHGPQVQRPKGKFGYVTDLARVAANPDYVVPSKPEASLLYEFVSTGEMPPPDSDEPPVTQEEVQRFHRWIAAMDSQEPPDEPQDVAAPTAPTTGSVMRLRRWLGRFHPASVHMPIGLLMAAALAELLTLLLKKTSLRVTVRFCLILGASAAALAAILGWWNADAPVYATKRSWTLWLHRWIGVSTALCASIAVILCLWNDRRPSDRVRRIYQIALFVSAALVSAAGFLGGLNVYGFEHYEWPE